MLWRTLVRAFWNTWSYLFRRNDFYRQVTEEYPDPVTSRTEEDLPSHSRGLLFNDIDLCTGCGDCVTACPVSCITLDAQTLGQQTQKKWVAKFEIDLGRCIFCGLCTEVCGPHSLTHTPQFERTSVDTPDLNANFGRGRISEEQIKKWEFSTTTPRSPSG
jgi:formate hydrogenlyase subunit 6/NADH:ubiquinone oxidoreductase subunit I